LEKFHLAKISPKRSPNSVYKYNSFKFKDESKLHHNNHSNLQVNELQQQQQHLVAKLKSKTKTNQKLLDLFKNNIKQTKELELKKQTLDLIIVEWKELTRKIECIFFIINFLAVIISPTFLFVKFLFRDLAADVSLQNKCSCELN
jgi:hypothetical protein